MDYLLEHPTSMPLAEAAMTYLFTTAPRLLSLVPAQDDGVLETGDKPQAARNCA